LIFFVLASKAQILFGGDSSLAKEEKVFMGASESFRGLPHNFHFRFGFPWKALNQSAALIFKLQNHNNEVLKS
jgi:hypothetical protein